MAQKKVPEKKTTKLAAPQEPVISEDELKIPNQNGDTDENEPHLIALLGVLVIVLILILAGLYLWSTSMPTGMSDTDTAPTDTMATSSEPMPAAAPIETNPDTSSDNLDDLEAELESLDMTEIDAELDSIDAELEAAAQ